MGRPNFSVSTNDTLVRTNSNGTVSTHSGLGSTASENVLASDRSKKPEGWLPPKPYSLHRSVWKYPIGSVLRETTRLSTGVTEKRYDVGCVSATVLATYPNWANRKINVDNTNPTALQRSTALVKARLKMKEGDLNLAVAFAERNATARLVGKTATTLARAYRAIRRGDFERAARLLGIPKPKNVESYRSITERWLEYQYGWRPLLNDVYNSVEALSKRPRHDWIVTAKVTEAEGISKRQEFDKNSVQIGPTVVSVEGVNSYFVRIDAIPGNDLTLALASLGITNPALVAWELVPYSFVVDWFLPIGQFLDSLDAMLGYSQSWSSITKFRKRLYKFESLSVRSQWTGNGYLYRFTQSLSGTLQELDVVREADDSVPLPVLPSLKDPRSLDHMANGLSLMAGAFGRSDSPLLGGRYRR